MLPYETRRGHRTVSRYTVALTSGLLLALIGYLWLLAAEFSEDGALCVEVIAWHTPLLLVAGWTGWRGWRRGL